ncbi:hypothetical protein SO802_006626 [Lithocarpus litseifolius]|uniref:Reverse transcriptase domain-containing protein n=1 Tax=Lithocarpus litseifolius TaxID=425828 RepID=A0AAW2DPK0_9ROSI
MREGADRIYMRLDRVLATDDWRSHFQITRVHHLIDFTSNHCVLLISDKVVVQPPQRHHFHFKAMWTHKEECKEVIQDAWNACLDISTPEGLALSLRTCAANLSSWSHSVFGHIPRQIQAKRTALQSLVLRDSDGSLGAEINSLRKDINDLLDSEDIYWSPRSRVQWLREGDCNTKFFHFRASKRKKKNTILGLRDDNGTWYDTNDTIVDVAIKYFRISQPASFDDVTAAILTRVTDKMNRKLIKEFSKDEILTALKQMHPTKAPGPDGMLKVVLPQIITENQNAFLTERLITDNILVAFEIMHYLSNKREGKESFMAVKLDMSKAFDCVEWGFIEVVMEKLEFHERWINLIMYCITMVTYSVLINGKAYRCISPTRGLRQGDPLSLYLFILYAEGLSSLINRAARNKELNGISISQGCSQETKEVVLDILGPMQDSRHSKYFGLPSIIGKSKNEVFVEIKEKVGRKLSGWKEKMLSMGDKEILIKSIHSSLKVIRKGTRWCVGNGKTIHIWEDKWLHTPTTYKVISQPYCIDDFPMVFALIDHDTKRWKADLVKKTFLLFEVDNILNIPLSYSLLNDKLIWLGNKRGEISVRSAYYVALPLVELNNEGDCLAGDLRTLLWKKVGRSAILDGLAMDVIEVVHESFSTPLGQIWDSAMRLAKDFKGALSPHSNQQDSLAMVLSVIAMESGGPLGHIISGIRSFLLHLYSWSLHHLKRDHNRAAHELAQLAKSVGRATFIKSVAQAIPIYAMSAILLPKGFCDQLDASMHRFWWNPNAKSGLYWTPMSWSSLCWPQKEGGLGFRNFWDFNQALFSKFGWWIVSGKDYLCVQVLKEKYKVRNNWLSLSFSGKASSFWKSLMSIRHLVAKAACFQVGNGASIRIWSDPWIPNLLGFIPSPKEGSNSDLALVVLQLLTPEQRKWDTAK